MGFNGDPNPFCTKDDDYIAMATVQTFFVLIDVIFIIILYVRLRHFRDVLRTHPRGVIYHRVLRTVHSTVWNCGNISRTTVSRQLINWLFSFTKKILFVYRSANDDPVLSSVFWPFVYLACFGIFVSVHAPLVSLPWTDVMLLCGNRTSKNQVLIPNE